MSGRFSRLRRVLLVAALAGTGLAAMLAMPWNSGRIATPPPAAPLETQIHSVDRSDALTVDTDALPAIDSTIARPATPAILEPLPAASAPFASQLPVLVARAEAGDPIASCRLILNATRCAREIRSREFANRMVQSLENRESKSDELLINAIARSKEREAASAGFCDGIDLTALPSIDHVFERAIHAFSPRQKTILALSQSDGRIRRLQRAGNGSFSESSAYIVPQVLADHTLDFLMEGFHARDPLALEGLVMLHAPSNLVSAPGIRVALPNPRLFLQYTWLMERVFGRESLGRHAPRVAELVASTMSPHQLAEIERFVDLEMKRWLAAPDPIAFKQMTDSNIRRASLSRDAYCDE